MSFILSNIIILSVFTGGIATAYSVCKVFDVPFYNSNTISDDLEKLKQQVIQNYFGALYMTLIASIHLDKTPHTFIGTLFNLALYSLSVEFLYYVYHRAIHTHPFYKNIHSFHHTKTVVYPIDALYFSPFDLSCYIACLHIPVYLLKLSLFEYTAGLYFYVTMGFFSHSNLAFQHHILHHKFFKYNYCLVFPFFDVAFDTFKSIEFDLFSNNRFEEFIRNDDETKSDSETDSSIDETGATPNSEDGSDNEVALINHSDAYDISEDDSIPDLISLDDFADGFHDDFDDDSGISQYLNLAYPSLAYPDNIMNMFIQTMISHNNNTGNDNDNDKPIQNDELLENEKEKED